MLGFAGLLRINRNVCLMTRRIKHQAARALIYHRAEQLFILFVCRSATNNNRFKASWLPPLTSKVKKFNAVKGGLESPVSYSL